MLFHLLLELLLLFLDLSLEKHLLLSKSGLNHLFNLSPFLYLVLNKSDSGGLELVVSLLAEFLFINLGH